MLINLIFLSLIHTQTITNKHLSLALNQDHVIDVFNETGYIYYYYLDTINSQFTDLKYCQIHPQKLTIKKLEQLKITHQNEIEFEKNFINGTYYGKSIFIKQAVINNYGIIMLTNDYQLKFILHKNYQQTNTPLNFTYSLEDSILLQNEKLNTLMLLLSNNIVYEYSIDQQSTTNFSIIYKKQYPQNSISTKQLIKIQAFDSYYVSLDQSYNLEILIKDLSSIYQLQDKVIYFETESTYRNNKITVLYQNYTIYQFSVQFNENEVILSQTQFKIETRIPHAQKFTFYDNGILVIVDDGEGSIVIDYLYENNTLNKINTQFIEQKINHILIYEQYAILICDEIQKEIIIGINQIYLNQQNFQIPQTVLIPNIINTLVYNSVTENKQIKQMYAYTNFQMLKLNLKKEDLKIVCTCHNVTEAETPLKFKFIYYNSECIDCYKEIDYQISFKYPIFTTEQKPYIYLICLIGFLLFIVIIGITIYQNLEFRKTMSQYRGKMIVLETQPTLPQMDNTIDDSKMQFEIDHENSNKQPN